MLPQVWTPLSYSRLNRKQVQGGPPSGQDAAQPRSERLVGPGESRLRSFHFHSRTLTLSSPRLILKACKSRLNWQYKNNRYSRLQIFCFHFWFWIVFWPVCSKWKVNKVGCLAPMLSLAASNSIKNTSRSVWDGLQVNIDFASLGKRILPPPFPSPFSKPHL